MREAGDCEQRDDGAVVRQRIHAAAGHGGDAMQDLERDFRRLGGGNEGVGHRSKGDAHAAGSRSGDAGQHGHADGFVDERIGNCPERVGDQREAGQQRDHAAESVLRRGIHRRQQGSGDRRLAAVGEFCQHRPPGKHEHGQYAEQQRAFHRPDGRHAGDLGDDRLGAERDFVLSRRRRAAPACVSTKFATPTTTSGERAIQGFGSFSASNGSGSFRRLVP